MIFFHLKIWNSIHLMNRVTFQKNIEIKQIKKRCNKINAC